MPRNVIPVRFKPDNGSGYLMDIGTEIAANSRFVLPPDVTEAQAATILANIGAEPLSANTDPIPCPDTVNADLRKLQFLRSSGGSMSVPVSNRANLEAAALVILGILNGAGDDVVCIKLMGEFFPDLADELGLNYQNTVATSHVSTGESKQFYNSGQIAYASDVGSTVFQPVKSITDNEDAPATQIATAWAGCVGDFENTLACRGKGRKNPRKHRRFELTFAVGTAGANPGDPPNITGTETIELPVKSSLAADILSCGQAAAALPGAYCINYTGESYDRFHKILP
ncbi:MAG: hypothetical protein AAF298_28860 [Cyanobacteria bacterium P01_A01_bin.40]